ncbi:MAG: hypothetical protein KDA21_13885 [Phycisphaerales bacterium]|nr:hypothetical protein [Phycisphaerales bacterium]
MLHHLARSGGTLMSRCLGCMKGMALLSEIHPQVVLNERVSLVSQARDWFRLLRPEEIARLRRSRADFATVVATIAANAEATRRTLVIRDWSHIDFHAAPYVRTAAGTSALRRALEPSFTLIATSTVRHPIDQWLSLRRLTTMQGAITLGQYLQGCRVFAEYAVATGFLRYEDFTRAPDDTLRQLTTRLQVPFDPEWVTKWEAYDRITGAVSGTRGSGGIVPLPRQPHEPELLDRCAENADYQRTLQLLGYGHPE